PSGPVPVLCATMALDPRTPVVVGSGQVVQRASGLDDARSPVELMAEAVDAAAADAGLAGVPAVDAIRVVQLLSWRYRDPARFVAERLGVSPREHAYTTGGGNTPQMLVNLTADEIQRGELDIAVLAGGEAWRTRMRARRAGVELWDRVPEDVEPNRVIGHDVSMTHPAEQARGLLMPVQVYPMFETALRAAAGESVDEHQTKVSELWSRFSAVAAANPYAWVRRHLSAEEIRTPGPDNRMIGFPYPKYMNSNNDVDQAAAVIMCSVDKARSLGIAEDRWVFVHSGADTHEHYYVSNRWRFDETPAIRIGGARALSLAGKSIDDIDLVDLYSCFPSAVQLGAASLGLSLDRQLTRTGGLPFAGGPWNNYVMHGIATLCTHLRDGQGRTGLVWGNGGFATKHSFGVYSTEPSPTGFRHDSPQAEVDAMPSRALAEPPDAAGSATVEAYTVMHTRSGEPETAFAACLLSDGRRAWGTSHDADLAAAMCEGEWVGRAVTLDETGTLVAL
ncbi:MAG TPA: acetyl-CoA acetyltransferase, partial [Acidimicrobiales bacterium]